MATTADDLGAQESAKEQHPRGFTLFYKVLSGFGGLILLMSLIIAFTLYKLSSIEKSTISVIEYQQPNTMLFLAFQQDINLAIAHLNEYLLTGEERDIANYQQVENRLNGYLVNIVEMAEDSENKISLDGLGEVRELIDKFREQAKQLLYLRDNTQANYPGIQLATETLNPPALEFLGLINSALDEEDIEGSPKEVAKATKLLNELRFSWLRMMNSFRLYFTQVAGNELTNFNLYLDQTGVLLKRVQDLDVSVGFDTLDQLVSIRETYMAGLPQVIEMRNGNNWRQDINNMRNIVQPIVSKLREALDHMVYEQSKATNKSGHALTKDLHQIRTYTIGLLVFSILAGILITWLIIRSVIPPLRELMSAAKNVADGDLNAEVVIKSKDEIGLLGVSFNAMVYGLRFAELQKQEYLDGLELVNTELEERVAKRTAELKTSEARIRAVYDNVGEGIIVIDDRGYIESINAAAKRIFGIDEKQVEGMHAIFLLADKKYSDLAKTSDYDDQKDGPFKASESKHPVELDGKRMDGSSFPMEMVVTGMSLGEKTMRACIVRDITQRKMAEQQLEDAQNEIVNAAHKSGMAEMATGVLHNIGNILNSVNVSVEEVSRIARTSKVQGLLKANKMLTDNMDNIGEFMTTNEKGKKLPDYYNKIGHVLEEEFHKIVEESKSLSERTTMMKEVISTQQAYATSGFFTEEFDLVPLIEDALKVQQASLHKWGVKVRKDYDDIPFVSAQKSKLLQVVTNLIKNAKEATEENDALNKPKELRIETGVYKDKTVYISVYDNGCGISEENLSNIFNHGFTTKESGHGFGLHSSANAMTEMGGALTASSDGIGKGACFTLSIPIAGTQKRVSSNNS